MSDEKPPGILRDWEWVLAHLVGREEGVAAPLDESDEATIRLLEAEWETIVDQLRQPPPVDDFAEESGCRRAIELIEQIPQQQETSPTAAEPQQIGPYLVKARLRQGGMGTVYRALHTKLQRTVAIKVLPKFRTRDAAAVTRFEREMQALGGLNHRNIVAATDAGEVDGMQYLVMEYVTGSTCQRWPAASGRYPRRTRARSSGKRPKVSPRPTGAGSFIATSSRRT